MSRVFTGRPSEWAPSVGKGFLSRYVVRRHQFKGGHHGYEYARGPRGEVLKFDTKETAQTKADELNRSGS